MEKRTAKIRVRSIEEISKEWKMAFEGKFRYIQPESELVFVEFEAVAQIFSRTRMELLKCLLTSDPKSIYELAKFLGRDFKNVHQDVEFLRGVGLLDLVATGGARKELKPVARYSSIELELVA